MAVQARNNLLAQQRLDLTHILAAESFTAFDFRTIMTMFTGSTATYIMRGFQVTGKSGLTISVNVSDAMVVNPQDNSGSFYRGLPSDPDQIVQLPANQTNVFVEATFQIQTMAPVSAAFWNPLSLTGEDVAGDEFSASTDSQVVIVFTITSNTTQFTPGSIPLYRITTDSSSVTNIEDARNLMFRLGKGGVTPNPAYRFPWSVNRQDSVLSGSGVDNDSNSSFLRQDGTGILNDKGIYDMKSWMDAVMTRFIEITGSSLWFSSGAASVPVTGLTLSSFFFDSDNGSYINPTASNTLKWNQDNSGVLTLQSNGLGISAGRGTVEWQFNYGTIKWELGGTFVNNVAGGTRTYLVPTFTSGAPCDGGNVYLFLEREVPKGSGNSVQWASTAADPINLTNPSKDVSGQAGDFTGIAVGDYIRKSSEGYSRYSQVVKMVDGLGGIFTTVGYVADNTITGLELADTIISGPSSEPLIYFRSRYSNADLYVDTVVGQFNFRDLDYYWIGRRVGSNFILKNHGTMQPGEEFKIEDPDSVNGTGGQGGGDLTVQHAGLAAFSGATGPFLSGGSGTVLTLRRRKRDNTVAVPGPTDNSTSYLTYTIPTGQVGPMNVGDGLWARLSDTTSGTLTSGNVTNATDAQNETTTVTNVFQVLSAANSPLRSWDNRDVYLIARCISTNVLQFLDGTQLSLNGRYQETATEFAQNVQLDGFVKLPVMIPFSVLFLDATDTISEDNSNFFYNPSIPQLGVINYRFGDNTLTQATPGDMTWFGNLGNHTWTLASVGSTIHILGALIVDGGVTAVTKTILATDDKTLTLGVGNTLNGGGGSGINVADNTLSATQYASTNGQIYIDVTYSAAHGYSLGDTLFAEANEPVGGITAGAMNRGYTVVTTGSLAGDAQITSPTTLRLWTNGTATSTQTIVTSGVDPQFRTYTTPSWIYMTDASGSLSGMTSWGLTVKGKNTVTVTPATGYTVIPTAAATNTATGNIPFLGNDASGPAGANTTFNYSNSLNWNGTTLTVGGGLAVTGNFDPSADNLYNLGEQNLRWKTINVGPGSIHVWQAPTNTTSTTVVSLQFTGTTAQLATDAATPLNLTTGSNVGWNMDTAGRVGLYSLPNAAAAWYLAQSAVATTGTTQRGMWLAPQLSGTTRSTGIYVAGSQVTAAATDFHLFTLVNTTLVTGGTIVNQAAIKIEDLTSGTNNYGILATMTSGAAKWFIYSSGTSQSYHLGSFGLGTATTPSSLLHLQQTAVGTNVIATIENTAASFTGNLAVDLKSATKEYQMAVGGTANATAALQDAWYLQDVTGTATRIIVSSAGNVGIGIGATVPGALLNLGTNTAVASGGMLFGTDTNLYRVAANGLKTDGNMTVGTALAVGTTLSGSTLLQIGTNTTTAAGGAVFGTDTTLYRSAAATLKTDGSLVVGVNLSVAGTAGIGATAGSTVLTVGTNTTTAAGGILFGTDTQLYRSAASTLTVGNNLVVLGTSLLTSNVGIGPASINPIAALALGGVLPYTGSATQYGIQVAGTMNAAATTALYGVGSFINLPAYGGATAITAAAMFSAISYTRTDANPTVAKLMGFWAQDIGDGTVTNKYGFYSDMSLATGRWAFYANGAATSYLAGGLGLGNATQASINSQRLLLGSTADTTAAGGMNFGTDVPLYRSATTTLTLGSHFLPQTDITWDLGSASFRWRNVFAQTVTTGSIAITGALNVNYGATKTSTYTVTTSDTVVPYDTTGGAFTITLPASVAGNKGQMVILKDVGGQINQAGKAMTLAPNGTDTIDTTNASILVNFAPFTALTLISNGAGGWIIT